MPTTDTENSTSPHRWPPSLVGACSGAMFVVVSTIILGDFPDGTTLRELPKALLVAAVAGIVWVIVGLIVGALWHRIPTWAWIISFIFLLIAGGYIWLVALILLSLDLGY